jgi:hypothetical protein
MNKRRDFLMNPNARCLKLASFLVVFCGATAFADPPARDMRSQGPGVSPTGIQKQATDITSSDRRERSHKARCDDAERAGLSGKLSEPSAQRHHHTRMQGGTKGAEDPCEQAGQVGLSDEVTPGSNSYTGN